MDMLDQAVAVSRADDGPGLAGFAERRIDLMVEGQALSLFYQVAGAGPPLLLLHGLGDSALSWHWVLPTLARTHTVYALDLPGFGLSSRPAGSYTPAFLTTVVTAFLDALALASVGIVGNSLGGLIALRLALAAPERVTALGLIASAGLGRGVGLPLRLLTLPGVGEFVAAWNRTAFGAWQWTFGMALQLFAAPWRVPWLWLGQSYRMARSAGFLAATVATARSELTLAGQRREQIMREQLDQLSLPTMVVWGRRDRMLPFRHGHAAAASLSHSQFTPIPNAGHLPHVERPAEVAFALSRFFVSPTANLATASATTAENQR